MANIMITERCNLQCEYCFANEFVNGIEKKDITIPQLQRILKFIIGDGTEKRIGLIGGEPLCHPKFHDIINTICENENVENVLIYTNGILLKEYITELENEKVNLLVNCNDLSYNYNLQKQWDDSLDVAFKKLGKKVGLGVNFYKPDFEYRYILDLVEKYNCDHLRVSISVPNNTKYSYRPLEYFKTVKPHIFRFFSELEKRNVVPYFDCNVFPACLVSVDEMKMFSQWKIDNPFSIVKNHGTGCKPVIDIMPDLTAVRCFGLSEYTKTKITDFASISDLRNYYMKTIDAFAINCNHTAECDQCYKYKTVKCSGGCLIYKIDKILNLQKMVWNTE